MSLFGHFGPLKYGPFSEVPPYMEDLRLFYDPWVSQDPLETPKIMYPKNGQKWQKMTKKHKNNEK